MARFISILSGSNPNLAFHDTKTISNGTALRAGLIASRSALSADIYAELFPENQSGGKGVFFPADLISTTAVAGQITGSAYTSSREGIVTPANYSTRPTASVLSTTSQVVPTNPLNRASASLATYESASVAVSTVLNGIQDGGPYGRIGLNPSRTLHTVYHDPDTRFFAWDDFTPGTPASLDANVTAPPLRTDNVTTSASVIFLENGVDNLSVSVSWLGQYLADTIGPTTASIAIRNGTSLNTYSTNTGSVNGAGSSLTATNFNIPAGNFVGNSNTQNTVEKLISVRFSDVTIPTHHGPTTTTSWSGLLHTSVGPVRPFTVFGLSGARVSQSVDGNFCTNATAVGKIYSEASTIDSSNRLYSGKTGAVYAGPSANSDYYIAVGTITSGVTSIYRYNMGKRLDASTATCSDLVCYQVAADTTFIASSGTDCDTTTPVPTLTYMKGSTVPQQGTTLYSNDTCTTTYTPGTGFVKVSGTHAVDVGVLGPMIDQCLAL
jgi:hypothetical protein